MGILNFNKHIKERYPACNKSVWRDSYDYIYLDLNFYLHRLAPVTDTIDQLVNKLGESIINDMRYTIPTKAIILAADGPAPYAKMFLQRQRRQFSTTEIDIKNSTLNFTPGTTFMKSLRTRLDRYIQYLSFVYSIEVIDRISGENEGEIKIKQELLKYIGGESTHLIISNDADMILLASSTKEVKGVYVLHKNSVQSANRVDVINIEQMHIEFKKDTGSDNMFDISVISLLVGNDYLPKVVYTSLDNLWAAYTVASKINSGGLVSNTNPLKINKEFMIDILLHLNNNAKRRINYGLEQFHNGLYGKYLDGILWCVDMYLNGHCHDYSYTYGFVDSPHPIGLVHTLLSRKFELDNCDRQPMIMHDDLYSILLLPYKAKVLIDPKYHKFIEKTNSLYLEEHCEKCIELKDDNIKLRAHKRNHTQLDSEDIREIKESFDDYLNTMST